MRHLLYLFSILIFWGIIAFQVYAADVQPTPASTPKPAEGTTVKSGKSNSSDRQVQPVPEPAEATNLNSSKSNRQTQPTPEPAEGTTVKGSKSNSSERVIQPAPTPESAGKVKGSKSNTSE